MHSSPIYPTPKYYALHCFSVGHTTPQSAHSCVCILYPRLIYGSLDSPVSAAQIASRSVQPYLHSSRQNIRILYNGPPLSPLKLPLRMGDLIPRLIHGSMGQPEWIFPTASRSVQPLLQDSRSWLTKKSTDIGRPRYCVRSNRLYL